MSLPAPLARLRFPVIGSPLVIISGPELVIPQCKAGGVGSLPALNARHATQVDEWLHQITEALAAHDRGHPDHSAAPFVVNQIVHRSNTRLEQDVAARVRRRVPLVITSLGARVDVNGAVHSYDGLPTHVGIDEWFARKAVEKGADGLIAVAAGAGGHAGTLSPVALVGEIRAWFDGPLKVSGSIASGRAVAAALATGRTSPISVPRPSRPKRRARRKATTIYWSRAARPTSSTPTSSPACTATISSPRSAPQGSTPTACRSAIPARWTSARGATGTQRRGATSGPAARESARLTTRRRVAGFVDRLEREFRTATERLTRVAA